MESVGGRITASNRADGGAVFELEFPAAPHSAADISENVLSQLSRCCSFLLIDDDVKNLDALKEVLLLRGHCADTAQSGSEALEKIASASSYDVVLCDLAMPGMNGWEVARVALETNPDLKFYIVTGWGEQVQSDIPPNLPVRGVLSKPIDLGKLERIAAMVTERTVFTGHGNMEPNFG